MNNPFMGYGRPVSGERLIGRETELKKIENRILNTSASLSIVGQRRIGKTSLITEVRKRILIKKPPKLVLLFLDLSVYSDSSIFFNTIIDDIKLYLEDSNIDIPQKLERVLSKSENTPYESYRVCRRCLVILKQLGISTKIVIDEFDAIRKYNKANQVIQWLRELIDKGFETGLSVIFISRRSLFQIEEQIVHVSNIDHVCEKVYVKPLDINTLDLFINRASKIISPTNNEILTLGEYTGGHPYITEMILCHSCEAGSIKEGIQYSTSEIFNYYEHLKVLLEEDDLFDQLIQLVIGPKWKLKTGSASNLKSYGLLKENLNGNDVTEGFQTWSVHFQDYLSKISRESPIWEKWAEAEILIRDFIVIKLESHYGDNWMSILKAREDNLSKIIFKCENIMQTESKKFGLSSQFRWIDYTYPHDLWQIITLEWSRFSNLLQENNHNKKYWSDRFDLLAKIRNPLAHNRSGVISEYEITLANAYCDELILIFTIKNTVQLESKKNINNRVDGYS